MTLPEILEKINSELVFSAIVAGLIIALITAVFKGILSVIKHKGFKDGFFRLFVWFFDSFVWTLRKLVWPLRQFARGLFLLLKLSIKRAVLEIVSESQVDDSHPQTNNEADNVIPKTHQNFVLSKEYGANHDDNYYSEMLDLMRYSYMFKLKRIEGQKWRLGFKLSYSDAIPTNQRQSKGFPLVHLSKDLDGNDLIFDQYISPKRLSHDILWDKYDNDPIELGISKSTKGIHVTINVPRSQHKRTFDIHTSKRNYALLFAWGDGDPYKISFEMERFKQYS